jgi:hypothetical protein
LTDNGQLPVWQPGDEVPAWAAKLQEPFPASEIGVRPQLTCSDCSKSQKKFCGQTKWDVEHVLAKCPVCKQKISRAHMHLFYVGHADATGRLLDADPKWFWRPMARDIDPEVLKAAIATGDLAIVQTVIAAFPPKIDQIVTDAGRTERIMWIELVVHDENGNEVITPGVGDAIGKPWGPNALKEMIGDAVRNSGQRRGLALDLWRKIDLEQARKETTLALPEGYSAGAVFDQVGEENQDRPAKGRSTARKPREAPPDTGQAGVNPEAQAIADLAWKLRGDHVPPEELRVRTHTVAMKKGLLVLHCQAPWDTTQKVTVQMVIGRAREELEAHHAAQPAAQG